MNMFHAYAKPAALMIALLATLSACGSKSAEEGSSSVTTVYTTSNATTTSSTSTSSTTTGTDAPLSFEFTLLGSQTAITPAFSTDNVLKAKFQVTAVQGNSYHSASELALTLSVNGTEFTPKYTYSEYTYGQVGETSNVIDLSGYISPGSSIQITMKNPKNDFYCTYAPNPFYYWDGTQYAPTNPLYNVYPGCRKAVNSSHNWGGVLIVQTSSTVAI